MYRRLQRAGIPIPETVFLAETDLTPQTGAKLLEMMESPLVLKAPNTSFSLYVERVSTPRDFVRVGKRLLRRADRIIAQRFVRSEFDWRVGILAGEVLFVCRYLIPKRSWKILTYIEGRRVAYGGIDSIAVTTVNGRLLQTAIRAASAIGNGLYGVDLKQIGDDFVVIEVNDNPTMAEGEEDQRAPHLYERLIRYLAGEWG